MIKSEYDWKQDERDEFPRGRFLTSRGRTVPGLMRRNDSTIIFSDKLELSKEPKLLLQKEHVGVRAVPSEQIRR